jgi:hypothetical protein
MADEIKINRTAQPAAQRPEHSQPMAVESRESAQNKSSKTPWVILGIIVVALVVLGVVFRDKMFKKSTTTANYQAVFLTNGQVYFGKLSNANRDYVTVKDIYYLQVGPQQGSGAPATTTPSQSISLVKLGNELHGPTDEMHISRSQILFYEDLKEDGQVVTAIVKDKNEKK